MQLLKVFESQLTNHGTGTELLCRKALASLKQSLMGTDAPTPEASDLETALYNWQEALSRDAIKPLTRRRYIESLRALWNKAAGQGLVDKSEIFNVLIEEFAAPEGDAHRSRRASLTVPDVNIDRLRQVALQPPKGNSEIDLMRDIFLYTLYNAGLDPEAIPALHAGGNERECRQAQAIVDRYAAPRRKYLFPLSQGRTTNRQIALTLQDRIPTVVQYFGYPDPMPFTRTSVQSLWTAAARRCNLTDADIRATLECQDTDDAEDRYMMLSTVADYINDSTPQWYAMKLRRGIAPEHILRRLSDDAHYADHPLQTYYPCEEINKRIGKKMKHVMRAYISEVLFFRVPFYEILPLFRIIGDMAWCYRSNNTPGAPYAVIHDIERFQKCIGQLTPDMQVDPLDNAELGVGQMVRITGGCMEGYEGEIFSQPKGSDGADTNTRILKLKLISDKGIKITLDIPEYYIEKIE